MKKILSVLLTVMLVLSCFQTVSFAEQESSYPSYTAEIMKAKGGANAIVSMTFDDGIYDTAVYLNDAFERYGLKGSCMMIASKLNDSNLAKWQELFAEGNLEPQSHTMTHLPIPSDSWAATNGEEYLENNTAENYQIEIVDSKAMLEEYFPEYDVITFAPSNNTLSDGAYEVVMDTYYAVRQGSGGISSVQSLDPTFGTAAGSWHNLKMTGFSQSGSPTRLQALCERVDRCVNEGAWFISLTHGINDTGDFTVPEAEELFAYMAKYQNDGKLWCATFSEAVKYVRERQNSSVSEYENANGLFVELTMADTTEDGLTLDKDIFNYPLTVKAQLPEGWDAVSYVQGDIKETALAFEENGNTYAYIDIVPNGGAAKLSEAEKETVNTSSSASGYVENGENADVSFEEEQTLLVSGRSKAVNSSGDKMVYAEVDLSDYNPAMKNNIAINVTQGKGEVEVYGVSEDMDISHINYINAVANDRFSEGVDLSKVYGAAPIASISVNGAGLYSFDITDYAGYMTDLGKSTGHIIVVSETEAAPVVYEEDFNDGNFNGSANRGGEIRDYGVDAAQDLNGNGYAYRMVSKASYDRLYFNIMNSASWTEADIGRAFEVTYWFKADAAGTFLNRIQANASDKADQAVTQDYTTANQWQKFTYNFVYTSDCHTNAYNRFGFKFDGMPSNTMYIDNIVIRETSIGNIEFAFAEVDDNSVKFDFEGCASTYISKNASSAGSGVISTGKATITAGATAAELNTDAIYNHTKGGSNSFKMSAKKTYQRAFLFNWATPKAIDEEGNTLTTFGEADIGRSFEISFWLRSDKTGSFHVSMSNPTQGSVGSTATTQSQVEVYSVGTTDTWERYSYSFTVDENMVTNSYVVPRIVLSGFGQSDSDPVTIYIDDISVREEDASTTGYSYKADMESGNAKNDSSTDGPIREGWVANCNGFTVQPWIKLSVDENHTSGGEKSLHIHSTQTYNKVYLYNVADELVVGEKFKVSFWMKADKAGSFTLTMARTSTSAGTDNAKTYTVAESDVGVWKKYVYDFTVTEKMVENNLGLLRFVPTKFGQLSDNSVSVNFYIDDFESYQVIDGAEKQLYTNNYRAVSSAKLESEYVCEVVKYGSEDALPEGIRKAYISFAGSEEYLSAKKATLNLDIAEANGQSVKVYGLLNAELPEELTYNNAPASNADETIDMSMAYGGVALAEFEAEAGVYSIDVTEYIRDNENYLFVIVSEDVGGTQYISLDFETFDMTKGVDYIAESAIDLSSGAAKVSDTKISLLNIFGNGDASVKSGETYEISLDVTADSDSNIVVGAAKADGEMVGDVANISAVAGEACSVKFLYTATEEDEAAGVCAVAIESNTEGFAVDNLKVSSTTAVAINKTAELVIEKANATFTDDGMVTVNVTVVGGNGVTINGESKGATVTEQVACGSVLEMVAEGDGVFMYWIDTKSDTILSYGDTYSYTVGSDRSIAAVYAGETEVFVTFTSMANKLVASGISGSVEVPENPYIYGYKFDGWYVGGEKMALSAGNTVNVEESTEFKAGFVKDASTYTVVVDGVESSYAYNEKVTLTADAEKDGNAFSYWKRDGVIVSYDAEYSFYVNGATTVESVYGESVSKKAVLAMATPVLVGGNKIAFFAERDIPEDCEIIETGILMGTSASLNVDNAAIKAVAKSNANKGQFTVRKANVKAGDVYYGVAYTIYRDADGVVVTAYSNEVSYEVE